MQYLGLWLWFCFISIAVFGFDGLIIILLLIFIGAPMIALVIAHFQQKRDLKRRKRELREALRNGDAERLYDGSVQWHTGNKLRLKYTDIDLDHLDD